MDPDAVTTTYRRLAPIYDQTFGAITGVGRRRAAEYLSNIGGHVLELGVGTGLALPKYTGSVRVTGIDYSEEMLVKARKRVADAGLTNVAELRQMDARTLDFPDANFDAIAAMHIISVVPEPEKVLAEIARVCKPGGKVVFVNHFSRVGGVVGALERVVSPLENMLGWQSDFPIERLDCETRLREVERDTLPPFGVMTWLVMERVADGGADG